MRTLLPKILTEEQATQISCRVPNKSNTIWDVPEINELAKKIFLLSSTKEKPLLAKPSYWRVERDWDQGHKWHYDGCKKNTCGTFVKNHMGWCGYSASVLLTNPSTFTGGTFKFDNPYESHREDHYLSAVFYSSGAHNEPQLHMVEPYSGTRTVLLFFFKTI